MSNTFSDFAAEKYQALATKLELTQAQVRQLQISQEMSGFKVRNLPNQAKQHTEGCAPTTNLEAQYVMRGEFDKYMRLMANQYSSIYFELRQLRLEHEAYKTTVIEKRVADLEEREKLKLEIQRLQAQEKMANQALMRAPPMTKMSCPCEPKQKPRFVDEFRKIIENHEYGSQEEKNHTLLLLEDQLRWLGGRKTEFIEEMLEEIEDTLTEDFLKSGFLYEKYKENLCRLIEDVIPSTPNASSDCSEAEDEKVQVNKCQSKSVNDDSFDNDYDCAEGDDSMLM